jgi:hypothetical protein
MPAAHIADPLESDPLISRLFDAPESRKCADLPADKCVLARFKLEWESRLQATE